MLKHRESDCLGLTNNFRLSVNESPFGVLWILYSASVFGVSFGEELIHPQKSWKQPGPFLLGEDALQAVFASSPDTVAEEEFT